MGSGHLLDAITGEAEPRADQPTLHPRVQQRDSTHLCGKPFHLSHLSTFGTTRPFDILISLSKLKFKELIISGYQKTTGFGEELKYFSDFENKHSTADAIVHFHQHFGKGIRGLSRRIEAYTVRPEEEKRGNQSGGSLHV